MHLDEHVDSSQSLDEDWMVNIKRGLFFMRNVARSRCFIIDQTDAWRIVFVRR